MRKLNIIVMGIKRNLVFDKMLTAFYLFQSFKVLFAKSLTIFHFIGLSRILITSFESFSKIMQFYLKHLKKNIKQNRMSTTARGKFTIFAPLYISLIVKKCLQKGDPNLTFTSCPNRKSKFNI